MNSFEKLTEDAFKKIPTNIREKIQNVVICIEKEPSNEQLKKLGVRYKGNLLGLYEGVPKKIWGRGFGNNLPDKITLFENAIKGTSSSDEDLKDLIVEVVWHELAHHFGFNESEVRLMKQKKRLL